MAACIFFSCAATSPRGVTDCLAPRKVSMVPTAYWFEIARVDRTRKRGGSLVAWPRWVVIALRILVFLSCSIR